MTADQTDETAGEGAAVREDPDEELAPDERALLAAFDRLRPQGSLRWGFDDALRRVDEPNHPSAAEAEPWRGLPADLWDRGRSAKIGQRFVGDVASVLAELMAADSRAVADAAVGAVNGDRFVATWDALRYLSARVEALEARIDPLGAETAELVLPVPELREWSEPAVGWCPPVGGSRTVVAGELCDGTVVDAFARAGRPVRGVDPDGPRIWEAFSVAGSGAGTIDLVLEEVADHLASLPAGSVAGVVLAGCIDRLDLAAKIALLREGVRVTATGGRVVLLVSDQEAWDRALAPPARDLLPGRPLHPETWLQLLERSGTRGVEWHRPERGSVHAVVAEVER